MEEKMLKERLFVMKHIQELQVIQWEFLNILKWMLNLNQLHLDKH